MPRIICARLACGCGVNGAGAAGGAAVRAHDAPAHTRAITMTSLFIALFMVPRRLQAKVHIERH
jgi:hypothetical protein